MPSPIIPGRPPPAFPIWAEAVEVIASMITVTTLRAIH
jgi:hypothetical protein